MIDIQILVLSNSLISILAAIVAFDIWRTGKSFVKGSLAWFLGFLLIVPGIALVSFQAYVHPFLSIGIGNALLYFGTTFQVLGAALHVGRRSIHHLVFMAPAFIVSALHLSLSFSAAFLPVRMALFNGYHVLCFTLCAILFVASCPDRLRPSRYRAAITFGLLAVIYLFRLWVNLPGVTGFLGRRGDELEFVYLLLCILFIPASAFAEFKLVNGQLIANLSRAAEEKVLLVREMSHRTKNNLVLADSLVSLEGRRFEDPAIVESFEAVRSRLRSIGVLHDRLYRSAAVGQSLRLDDYLEGIVGALRETAPGIIIHAELEPLEVPVDYAVPLGLITSEAVTNSAKHAYPAGPGGRVLVRLTRQSLRCSLLVRDWGRGYDPVADEGLGAMIIESLASQLRGELRRTNENGAVLEVLFTPDGPAAQQA